MFKFASNQCDEIAFLVVTSKHSIDVLCFHPAGLTVSWAALRLPIFYIAPSEFQTKPNKKNENERHVSNKVKQKATAPHSIYNRKLINIIEFFGAQRRHSREPNDRIRRTVNIGLFVITHKSKCRQMNENVNGSVGVFSSSIEHWKVVKWARKITEKKYEHNGNDCLPV